MKDLERGPRAVLPRSRFSNIPRFRFDSRLKPVFASFFCRFLPRFFPVQGPFLYCSHIKSRFFPLGSSPLVHGGPSLGHGRVCEVLFCGSKPSARFLRRVLFGGSKRSGNTTSMGRQRTRARQGGQEEDAVGRKKRRLEGGQQSMAGAVPTAPASTSGGRAGQGPLA